jgi:hypothetical protein
MAMREVAYFELLTQKPLSLENGSTPDILKQKELFPLIVGPEILFQNGS